MLFVYYNSEINIFLFWYNEKLKLTISTIDVAKIISELKMVVNPLLSSKK